MTADVTAQDGTWLSVVRRVGVALTTEFEDVTVPESLRDDSHVYAFEFESGTTFKVTVELL